MVADDITADEILTISEHNPEKLYTNDLIIAKDEYHKLSKRFHPDLNRTNPKAEAAFKRIKLLYETAVARIKTGSWHIPFKYQLHVKGKIMQRAYRAKHTFELGDVYIGDMAVTYVVKHEYERLYNNALEVIRSLTFTNDEIKKQLQPVLPNIETFFKADEGLVLVLKKTPDVLLLQDVIDHFKSLDPKHVAWIYGRLCNICCYLQLAARITHNAINSETLFINPANHSVFLLGGWWYSSKDLKKQLLGIPEFSVMHGYPSIMRTKMPDNRNDLTLTRAVARQALGDVYGSKLRHNPAVPSTLKEFFSLPTTGHAQKDYAAWEAVRDKTFGPRKFIVLDVTAKDLYPDSF